MGVSAFEPLLLPEFLPVVLEYQRRPRWRRTDEEDYPQSSAEPITQTDTVTHVQADTLALERVRELHEFLLQQDPEQHLWRRFTIPTLLRFSDQPDLLRQAWTPDAGVLLDKAVYGAVLDLVEATSAVRRTAWNRYWRASQAVRIASSGGRGMTSSPAKPPRWWVASTIPPQELWQLAVDQLKLVDTEAALLAHLKLLMGLSAHSTRTLHRELTKRCKRAPSHTTIANWLNTTTIPRQFTEDILVEMVNVLVEDLATGLVEDVPSGNKVHMPTVIDAHKRVYRSLIMARHADQLHAGPIARALADLTAQEDALAPDDPARQPLQLAREALLRAAAHDQPAPTAAG